MGDDELPLEAVATADNFIFLETQYVDGMLSGNLRLTRLSYYRILEAVHKVAWIGDGFEAANVLQGSVAVGTSVVHNFFSVASTDCFVLCGIKAPLIDAKEVFWKDNYDAALQILSVDDLAQRLHEGKWEGGDISQYFEKPIWGLVAYDAEERVDPKVTKMGGSAVVVNAKGDPFRKRSNFSSQREWRIVFKPKDGLEIARDFVYVSMENNPAVIVENFRNKPSAVRRENAVADCVASEEEAKRILKSHIEEHRDRLEKTFPFFAQGQASFQSDENFIAFGQGQIALAEEIFKKNYRSCLMAYWKLRKSVPSCSIDLKFGIGAPACAFISSFEMYLSEFDQRKKDGLWASL